jgi:hypothetical protein
MAKKTKNIRVLKKVSSLEKQHPKHFLKVYWPYIPILAMVVFGMFFGRVAPQQRNHPATLAYATEMSISGLLQYTNSQRASNGLGPLTLNSKLNTSAQAKANNMVSRDYWAHNTPDGDEPWVFIDASGYQYQKAGENLAYGFSNSEATVIGWMNSPTHRANILDQTYSEVGFGFVNAENFVTTGQETVVVAHYGEPMKATASPTSVETKKAVTPQTPATKNASTQKPKASETPAAETPAEATPAPEAEKLKPLAEDRVNQPINTDNPVPQETPSTNITRLQRLTGGNAPWSALVVTVLSFGVVIIWLLKHAVLVKRFVLHGEHFVAHHPILDVGVVAIAAIAVYLSQSSGVVR